MSYFNLGSGIREYVPFRPSFSQILEYARIKDPEGFLRWLEAGADTVSMEDLVEEWAISEEAAIEDYFAMREVWGAR